MALITLRAWYLKHYEPIKAVVTRPHDLRLSRSSLLKSALRADFLEEVEQVQETVWFQQYLEGGLVEFYIEGSGSYEVANVDLISHEIYFAKRDLSANLDPVIFLSTQHYFPESTEALRVSLSDTLKKLNPRSRLPLSLVESVRPAKGAFRLSDTQLRKIRKCLLFIGDHTAISTFESGDSGKTCLVPSPQVSVETGYALPNKRPGQILLVSQDRAGIKGEFPYDLPEHQQLRFKSGKELNKVLPKLIETLLGRFSLFTGS
ncbi:MAG: hypothetical protein AAGG02_15990 [Cyanobacteria bacterium P01_H01_bin.15]